MNMLQMGKKKPPSCLSLLADLAETSFHDPSRAPRLLIHGITILTAFHADTDFKLPDLKTPMPSSYMRSPEIEYFRPPQRTRQSSRWKEDWEELELLVSSHTCFVTPPEDMLISSAIRARELLELSSRLAIKSIPGFTQVWWIADPVK
jgi:hypothetical protein